MIVISGALVLVALVLLIIGVVGPDLTFVYASIGVSLVSLVFLVIGILQRRGETAPAADLASGPEVTPAQDAGDGVTAVIPAQASRGAGKLSSARLADEPAPADTADEELETGGTVLVVEGRPRYHVEGCRYLSGKAAEMVDVLDARDEGFTACGVCKPDEALAAQDEMPVVQEDVPGDVVPAPTRAAKAPAKKAAKKTAAKKAPSRAATAAVAATPAAATAAKRAGSVVVIPDRGKYHRAECRYVRDVDGAEVLSKTAAGRQGYAACGVCKP